MKDKKKLKKSIISLRNSPEDEANLKKAAKNLNIETGEKGTISKTVRRAVKEYAEKAPFFVNEITFKLWVDIHQSSLRWLQGIASDYRSLSFGNITASELGDCLGRNLTAIKAKFNNRIETNLQRIGIDDNFILNNLRQGTADPLVTFETNLLKNLDMIDHIKNSFACFGSYSINVNNYTIQDGVISFTAEDKERIKINNCTTFLDSEPKKEFLKLAETTLKNLKELQSILQKNGIEQLFGYQGLYEILDGRPQEIIFHKQILSRISKL